MDTPAEAELRKSLRVESSDFVDVDTGNPMHRMFQLSPRVLASILKKNPENPVGYIPAIPVSEIQSIMEAAIKRADPAWSGSVEVTMYESAPDNDDLNNLQISTDAYLIQIEQEGYDDPDFHMNIWGRKNKTTVERLDPVVESVKSALLLDLLKPKRKSFVEKKMARIVGEKKGLDPLMVKKYIAGTRRRKPRRKTRKSKKRV